jgi:endoglucanase
MERVRPIVEKKQRLGADAWGTTDAGVRQVIGPLEELFERDFPNYDPFPFGARRHIAQLVRHMLLSEPLTQEWAERFRGVTADDIDQLMRSFLFENCRERQELAEILAGFA